MICIEREHLRKCWLLSLQLKQPKASLFYMHAAALVSLRMVYYSPQELKQLRWKLWITASVKQSTQLAVSTMKKRLCSPPIIYASIPNFIQICSPIKFLLQILKKQEINLTKRYSIEKHLFNKYFSTYHLQATWACMPWGTASDVQLQCNSSLNLGIPVLINNLHQVTFTSKMFVVFSSFSSLFEELNIG